MQLAFPHFPVPGVHPVSPSSRLHLLDYFPGSSGDTAPEYVGLIPTCHLLGHMPLLQGTHWPVCPQRQGLHPTNKETKAQRGHASCPGSQSQPPAEPGPAQWSPGPASSLVTMPHSPLPGYRSSLVLCSHCPNFSPAWPPCPHMDMHM